MSKKFFNKILFILTINNIRLERSTNMSKQQNIKFEILKNLNTNKCEFYLYNPLNNYFYAKHKSPYSSYDYSNIETSRVSSNLFTDASLLQSVPYSVMKQFSTAFIRKAIQDNNIFIKENFELNIYKIIYKPVKKGETKEILDEMNYTFFIRKIEDIVSFISSSSFSSIIKLIKDNTKKEDGEFKDLSKQLKTIKDKIFNDTDLHFEIDIKGDGLVVVGKGEVVKSNTFRMSNFIVNYVMGRKTNRNNHIVKCLEELLTTINDYVKDELIKDNYLQGNNDKLVKVYETTTEDIDKPFLSIDNLSLNTFNKFYYIRKLKPAISKNMEEEDKLYYQEKGTLGDILDLNKQFSNRKQEWDVVFEEVFPQFTKYLKHLFKDCWKEFLIMMAYKYNFPWLKIPCAFIIWGEQATGKSFLVDECLPIILLRQEKSDTESIRKPTVDTSSRFNSYMEDSLILFFDETNKKCYSELENTLKLLITAERMAVENKGENQKMVINKCWTFVSSNKKEVLKLLTDESEGRRYVCINTKEELVNSTGMTKNTPEGQKIYKDLLTECSKIVAVLSNKDVFNFNIGGNMQHYLPTPDKFKSINEINTMKNSNKFIHFIPIFKMLKEQMLHNEDNNTITPRPTYDGSEGSFVLDYKTNTHNKKYSCKVGFDVLEDNNKVNFFTHFKKTFAKTKGLTELEFSKTTKYLPYDSFSKFRRNIFNQKELESLFKEVDNNLKSDDKIKDTTNFLTYNEKKQTYTMFGESYQTIYENINKTLMFLEKFE